MDVSQYLLEAPAKSLNSSHFPPQNPSPLCLNAICQNINLCTHSLALVADDSRNDHTCFPCRRAVVLLLTYTLTWKRNTWLTSYPIIELAKTRIMITKRLSRRRKEEKAGITEKGKELRNLKTEEDEGNRWEGLNRHTVPRNYWSSSNATMEEGEATSCQPLIQ